MAHAVQDHGVLHGIADGIRHVLADIGNALIAFAESDPRVKRMQELQSMSDEELAAKGIRRDDIARYVAGGGYWM